MSEWQDIKTAPTDGTWVLVFDRSEGQRVARWMNDRDWYRHTGWVYHTNEYEGSDYAMHFEIGECDPTHWMPLPADPPRS